ncbi:MAG: dienelactone hydrolase family protein [Bacteroidetes bacterium]|nr:dienelactone hydrolase family protein [Bacteroidota bacterium]
MKYKFLLAAVLFVIAIREAAAQPDPEHPDFAAAPLQSWEQPFRDFAFHAWREDGHVLPYRLYTPPGIEPGKKYPLVIFFHGAGERGVDNRYQFFRFAPWLFWQKYPCYVIAPQCPPRPAGGPDGEDVWVQTAFGAPEHTMKAVPSWPMRLAMAAIHSTIAANPIDMDRIYVTGLSMGGFATWEFLQREPGLVAAAAPVCGGADTAYAPSMKNIPIWVFHGGADNTVLPKRSRDMVAALEHAGGHPKYTEFPGVGHGAWAKTYPDSAVWEWLFAQRKQRKPAAPLYHSTGSLRLPLLVGDHMVIQRDRNVFIWGWATAGQKVEVGFRKRRYRAVAGADGKWMVTLDACAAGGPYEMNIRAGKDKIVIRDILVGEVWLASGQSNMVLDFNNDRVKALYKDEIAASSNDSIRHLLVNRTYAAVPATGFASTGWKSANPGNLPSFSAAAYFFSLTLLQKYHVPIGIINASYGGTVAEAWTSEEGLKELPYYGPDIAFLKDTAAVNEKVRASQVRSGHLSGQGVYDPRNLPTALYNAMIAPLEPYGIRGVIWYQGEYNAHRAFEYRRLFPALIRDWRKEWGDSTLPFIYQQLPNFQLPVTRPSENEWAELREAQLLTLKAVSRTAMAVAIDIGGVNELHPADKKDVGIRLALQAERLAYGEPIVASGPLYRDMRVDGDKVILSFDLAGGELVAKGADTLRYFAIAGADRKFIWAHAVIRGNTVEVSSPQVQQPVAVRYAWAGEPTGCNLYNREGLPASPFRTDDWPGLTVKNMGGNARLLP